jgi:hypothetical protein
MKWMSTGTSWLAEPSCVRMPAWRLRHLLDHLVGDPADRLLTHRRAIDLGEMRRDLTSGQTLCLQRQHDLVHPLNRRCRCSLRPQLGPSGRYFLLQTTAGLDTYRVVALGPKQHLPRALFTREGPPWLAMITCGGRYNPAHGYTRNVVDYAEPVPN